MATIGRRDLLLLLLGTDDPTGSRGLGGITRIQKLLYLLDAEEGIHPVGDGFNFEAYKAGPYSPRIYDDLELLENLDYIRKAPDAKTKGTSSEEFAFEHFPEATDAEKSEVDLTFDELMGPEDVMAPEIDEISPTPDSYQETRYFLTEKGRERISELLSNRECGPFVDGIRKVKSKFANHSLNDLLYYVYTRHPEMTTESEIKEKVLRRRPA